MAFSEDIEYYSKRRLWFRQISAGNKGEEQNNGPRRKD
jgi:hypothetical protein